MSGLLKAYKLGVAGKTFRSSEESGFTRHIEPDRIGSLYVGSGPGAWMFLCPGLSECKRFFGEFALKLG